MSYTNIKTAYGDSTVDIAYYATGGNLVEYDPPFEKEPIWDQLGRILDGADNPFPKESVMCDDDIEVCGITPKDCIDIRNLILQFENPNTRLEFLKRLQSSENFKEVLEYVRSE